MAADSFGDHHVGCGGNGDKIFPHDSIRDAIFSAAQSAALAPRKEFPSLIPGCHNRPADVFSHIGIGVQLWTSPLFLLSSNGQYMVPRKIKCEERKMATHAASCCGRLE